MSFSVVIDSVDAYATNSVYDKKYAIDWSFLPEGEYDLTFSFVSSPASAVASDVKGIALEGLGTQLQVYLAGSQTDTKSSNLIGLLNRVNFNDGTARQRFQQPSFNPPVVLKQRPSNNIFSVKMINTTSGTGATSGMGGSYILMLHFNKRGDGKKNSLILIINDLRSKRDALSLAHEELKSNNDDWNKGIILLSLTGGLLESAKMKLNLNGAGWGLLPILISSIIASMSSLIKFRKYPERMEVLIQGISLLTNTLNKCRNHKDIDDDILMDYNMALEKLETSIYPSVRKKYLKISHKNLIEIMKQEKKYYDAIDNVNTGRDIESDVSSDDLSVNYSNSPLQTKRTLGVTPTYDKGELPQINEADDL